MEKLREVSSKKERSLKPKTTTIRIKYSLKKKLEEDIVKLNKSRRGSKKIDVSFLIDFAHSLLLDEHREKIINETITSEDRQRIAYATYVREKEYVSKAEFLDMIQYGEVQINNYLPKDMWKGN